MAELVIHRLTAYDFSLVIDRPCTQRVKIQYQVDFITGERALRKGGGKGGPAFTYISGPAEVFPAAGGPADRAVERYPARVATFDD